MPIEYSDHAGSRVAVVCCPEICANRLLHLSQLDEKSWVIRDFITGKYLRRAPAPNPSFSEYGLSQIESLVTYSEWPPFHNCENVNDWKAYLTLRTMAVQRRNPSQDPPNGVYGEWRDIE